MALPNPNVQESYYFERMQSHFWGFLDYTNLKFKKKFDKAYCSFISNPNEDTFHNAIMCLSFEDQIRICKTYLKKEELQKIRDFLNAIFYCQSKLNGDFE